jgi:hypothetical protein
MWSGVLAASAALMLCCSIPGGRGAKDDSAVSYICVDIKNILRDEEFGVILGNSHYFWMKDVSILNYRPYEASIFPLEQLEHCVYGKIMRPGSEYMLRTGDGRGVALVLIDECWDGSGYIDYSRRRLRVNVPGVCGADIFPFNINLIPYQFTGFIHNSVNAFAEKGYLSSHRGARAFGIEHGGVGGPSRLFYGGFQRSMLVFGSFGEPLRLDPEVAGGNPQAQREGKAAKSANGDGNVRPLWAAFLLMLGGDISGAAVFGYGYMQVERGRRYGLALMIAGAAFGIYATLAPMLGWIPGWR